MPLYYHNEEEMRKRIKELEKEIIELKQENRELIDKEFELRAYIQALGYLLGGAVILFLTNLFL